MTSKNKSSSNLKAVDFFCSAGGVTCGFQQAGNILRIEAQGPWLSENPEQWVGTPSETIISRDMVDESGKSKCFGFASFANHDDADVLVKAMHGTTIRDKEVYAGRAQKKIERVAQLKAEYRMG